MDLLENYLRFAHKFFWNVCIWLALAWQARYFMVCEQTCSCGHKMDESLWQTFSVFDLSHSSYMWVLTVLPCGKRRTTIQTRIISRLWFCRRPGRLKINIRWTLVFFGSQTFVPISWMCKKQTSVSHSSTEAELTSLDAVLRMDGAKELFHSSPT